MKGCEIKSFDPFGAGGINDSESIKFHTSCSTMSPVLVKPEI